MGDCGDFPGLSLGLVGEDGSLDHTTGRLRFVDGAGATVHEVAPEAYGNVIRETLPGDSYMKPTECTDRRCIALPGRPAGPPEGCPLQGCPAGGTGPSILSWRTGRCLHQFSATTRPV